MYENDRYWPPIPSRQQYINTLQSLAFAHCEETIGIIAHIIEGHLLSFALRPGKPADGSRRLQIGTN